MNLVITMAGSGQRFKKAGYTIPKYQIEVNGKTLFEWSMLSFKGMNFSNYIFIVKKTDNAFDFIKTTLTKMGITDNISIIELSDKTKGQAESALMAKSIWNENEELFIYNIDTYVKEYTFSNIEYKGYGFIPCFNAPGNHWSFVKLNENSKVVEIREKERISDNCTIGLYYFKTAKLYEELYNNYYIINSNKLDDNEYYIAPLYNQLIKDNKDIFINIIDKNDVFVLGTPEELNAFKNLKTI